MTVAPAYQVLAERIRLGIISGQLRPGERLPTEPQLCEQSGVSRSTVREALRLLSSQHLIVTIRGVNGGSFVAEPDPHALGESLADGVGRLLASGAVTSEDFLEVRRMLEVPAAGIAASRRQPHHLAELEGAMFDPDNDDLERRLEAHAAFHLGVLAATGNSLLGLVARPLYSMTELYNMTARTADQVPPPPFWHGVDHDHRALLAAIQEGDVARAMELARSHIDNVRPPEQFSLSH